MFLCDAGDTRVGHAQDGQRPIHARTLDWTRRHLTSRGARKSACRCTGVHPHSPEE
jgi:hypothetical protein